MQAALDSTALMLAQGPDRRHHHDLADQRQGTGLFHRALHQHRRQVGRGHRDLHGQHQQGLDHPGQRLRQRHDRLHEGRGLPEHQLQHQFHRGLGQRADARRDGARQHRIDGRRRQDAGDADRRQEPDRPARARSPRTPATSTSRSFRSPRTSMSAPATTTRPGSTGPTGTPTTAPGTCSTRATRPRARANSTGKIWTPDNHNKWTGCVTDRDQDYDTKNTAPTRQRADAGFRPRSTFRQHSTASRQQPYLQPIVPLSYDWATLKTTIDAAWSRPATPTRRSAWPGAGMTLAPGRAAQCAGQGSELHLQGCDHPAVRRFEHAEPLVHATPVARSTPARRSCATTPRPPASRSTRSRSTPDGDPTSTVLQYCASGADKFYHRHLGEPDR